MTKFLLSCLLASAAVSGAAAFQTPKAVKSIGASPVALQAKSCAMKAGEQVISRKQLAKGTQLLTVKNADGRIAKRIVSTTANKKINPFAKVPKTLPNGTVFAEDFEAWDGIDSSWLPEGFAYDRKSGRECEGWSMMSESEASQLISGVTGNVLFIKFDSEFLDEWVVMPEITLDGDMILSFDTFNDGLWYFSTENVNWETMQYEGEKVLAFDQKVMISEDGGENWTELKSLAADFADWSFGDLMNGMDGASHRINVSLSEYAGKTVKLAYRYVGTDGNSSFIDNISIGKPALELNYTNPLGTLFFGMSPETYTLNMSILAGPVYKPWYFMNNSYADGATYSWKYMNADSEWDVSDEQDMLEVTYKTDYTSDFTTRNNLFHTPVLSGSAPGYSDGEFTRGQYLQAGGKGEFEAKFSTGETQFLNLGLGVIDPVNEGNTTVAAGFTPVFGYNSEVDKFWTDYTFGEDGGDENNYVKYEGYMNYFFNLDAPVVIKGLHTSGFAQLKEGARMKAKIIPLTDEGVPSEEALATAYCEYKDMLITPAEELGGTNDLVTFNFKFDEPIVMSSDVCMAYVVRISGFNDPENVEYFNPLMSAVSNPDGYAFGWISKTIVFEGEPRESFTAVANYLSGEALLSFYISLDAEFPWLEGPESVNIGSDGIATVTLDSSVAGEDLKFENLPSWLSASAEGIHNNTVVTFRLADVNQGANSATVTVAAPGVSHDITVNAGASAVAGVESEAAAAEIYSLSGVRVSDMKASGVYIVKDVKGNVHKVVKD